MPDVFGLLQGHENSSSESLLDQTDLRCRDLRFGGLDKNSNLNFDYKPALS
jgi:hypothetical protein